MTISATDSRADFNGNGVTDTFSFPYRFFMDSDLVVLLVEADGTVVPQVLDTDYTVNGADTPTSGEVVMVVPPATGERLVVYRDIALTQETDYISGGPFPAETHERALDKLTLIVQQQAEEIGRALKISVDNPGDPDQMLDDIAAAVEEASGFADDAAASAVDASEFADAASASATAADASADAAAASVASIGLPLSIANGGTGQTTAAAAFTALKQDASESDSGVLEIATAAESQALTDNTRAITPARLASAFQSANQSLATTGFQRLPGGLIVQWGVVSVAGGPQVITYALAFPTAAWSVVATAGNSNGANNTTSHVSAIGTANFTITNQTGVTSDWKWIAIGR